MFSKWYTPLEAGCAVVDTCFVFPDTGNGIPTSSGEKTWWIQTWNADGHGPWSEGRTYYYADNDVYPGIVTEAIFPITTTTVVPRHFQWEVRFGATWYRLYTQDRLGGNRVLTKWFTAAELGCTTVGSTCTANFDLGLIMQGDTVNWWVQTYANGGFGQWSARYSFTCNNPFVSCT